MVLDTESRFYAPVYSNASQGTMQLLDTTAQTAHPSLFHGEPLDPMEYKIRFPSTVRVLKYYRSFSYKSLYSVFTQLFEPKYYVFRSSPYTYVNFDNDVFFFNNRKSQLQGQLRFLFHNNGTDMPKDIGDDREYFPQ